MPDAKRKPPPHARTARKLSRRGAETERKFLDAANDVFWANGFAGAKIAQIITAGEASVGSFYHLFADKDALLDRAAERLLADFHESVDALDLSRAANGDLFTMLFRLSLAGRQLVARHRGIYRAMAELAQNEISAFGPLQTITPTVVDRVRVAIPEYADQMPATPVAAEAASAVQLIAMSGLQTELGMGPLYPADLRSFCRVIARAACGVLGYTGQTEAPAVDIPVTGLPDADIPGADTPVAETPVTGAV